MAKFEVEELEGMRYVKITLDNETVQAEAGALSSMTGDIAMNVNIPSMGRVLKSYLSEESVFRPTYTGTGIIFLESSFGGSTFSSPMARPGFWTAATIGRRKARSN